MIACLLSGDAVDRRPEYSITNLGFAPCPVSGAGSFFMGSPVFVLSPFLFPRKYFSLCELKEDLNSPPCVSRKGNIGGGEPEVSG